MEKARLFRLFIFPSALEDTIPAAELIENHTNFLFATSRDTRYSISTGAFSAENHNHEGVSENFYWDILKSILIYRKTGKPGDQLLIYIKGKPNGNPSKPGIKSSWFGSVYLKEILLFLKVLHEYQEVSIIFDATTHSDHSDFDRLIDASMEVCARKNFEFDDDEMGQLFKRKLTFPSDLPIRKIGKYKKIVTNANLLNLAPSIALAFPSNTDFDFPETRRCSGLDLGSQGNGRNIFFIN
jgi:hypothetical protein